jgi:hypothetical protein
MVVPDAAVATAAEITPVEGLVAGHTFIVAACAGEAKAATQITARVASRQDLRQFTSGSL